MPSLADPELNLRWAKKHLELLDERMSALKRSYSPNVTATDDVENGWYVVRIQYPEDQPILDIVLTAGDFVCRLRACLDHLAWQLATLTTSQPGSHICFPITEKDSLETQLKIVKSTYGIPDAAVALMKSFQPYNAGDLYKSTHLWRLNKLWNIDKHRHIGHHAVISDEFLRINVPNASFEGEHIDNCGIVKIPLAMKDKVNLNPSPGFDLRFGTAKDELDLGIDDLFEIHQFVADTVLPAFARFFK
ncbi:MAG: hypothetical protein LAN83_07910 [Acidobacteriia bacterium]|nr:hypothetical protein [Terriglobia bacterium]